MLAQGHQHRAGRIAIQHLLLGRKLFIRVFPDKPISKSRWRPDGHGQGRGGLLGGAGPPGTVLFEIAGVTEATAKKAMFARR